MKEVCLLSCRPSETLHERIGGTQTTIPQPLSTLRRALLGFYISTSFSMYGLKRRQSIPGEKSKSWKMEVNMTCSVLLSFLNMYLTVTVQKRHFNLLVSKLKNKLPLILRPPDTLLNL